MQVHIKHCQLELWIDGAGLPGPVGLGHNDPSRLRRQGPFAVRRHRHSVDRGPDRCVSAGSDAESAIDRDGRTVSAGLISSETDRIVNGAETNYSLATVRPYISIFSSFTSLRSLFGFAGSNH